MIGMIVGIFMKSYNFNSIFATWLIIIVTFLMLVSSIELRVYDARHDDELYFDDKPIKQIRLEKLKKLKIR